MPIFSLTRPTNFEGSIAATIGTKQFPVLALDPSVNATTNWYSLTITANGLPTSFAYEPAGNLLAKFNAAGVARAVGG